MAVARPQQKNPWVSAAIVFVALFLIAAVAAVVFYMRMEEFRLTAQEEQAGRERLANNREMQSLADIVGAENAEFTRLGQLFEYFNQLYTLTTGLQGQQTSAESRLNAVKQEYQQLAAGMPGQMLESSSPNLPGAIAALKMYIQLDQTLNKRIADLTQQLADMNDQFVIARKAADEKEEELMTDIAEAEARAEAVTQSYKELEELMSKEADDQVKLIRDKLEQMRAEYEKMSQELLENKAQLALAETKRDALQKQLDTIKPGPDMAIGAYAPDGEVLSIDTSSNIVFLNIGRKDKVYRGLTFAVFDKNAPVPADGKGKADIEVFDVQDNVSVARITRGDIKNPIVQGDSVVNMIWDKKKVNLFVVVGEFDFDGDGNVDADGTAKIRQLVENWGGKVQDEVTIDTDFVVAGQQSVTPGRPSIEDIEVDPLAMEKYDAAVKKVELYKKAMEQAGDMSIPVFNADRFMNFIGY